MKTGIYARVSTTDKGQDPELQLKDLRAYCQAREMSVVGEYVDVGISGGKDRRPELDKLMEMVRKRKLDCVVVWKLDRWGRSVTHLVNSIAELGSLGVSFVSYKENIDLSTSAGKLMFHIISAMAEFERDIIKERVRAGVAHARSKGKQIGRKGLAPVERKKIIDLRQGDPSMSVRTIARKSGQSVGSVHKTLQFLRTGKVDGQGFFIGAEGRS